MTNRPLRCCIRAARRRQRAQARADRLRRSGDADIVRTDPRGFHARAAAELSGRGRAIGAAGVRRRHAAFGHDADRADHGEPPPSVRRRRIADPVRHRGRLWCRGGSALRYPDTLAQLSPRDLQALGARYVAGIAPLAPRAARIVDKMPSNFLFAGLVHLALPNAASSTRCAIRSTPACRASQNCSSAVSRTPTSLRSSAAITGTIRN